jgi:uncharacterized integral membrane protein
MKYLSWIVSIPLTIIILLFVFSNFEPVSISLWPFITTITAPLAFIFILTVFISFFSGLAVMWFMQHKYRVEAKKWEREANSLQAALLNKGGLEPPPITRAISTDLNN